MKLFIIGASGYIGKLLYEKGTAEFTCYGTSSLGISGLLSYRLGGSIDFNYELISAGDTVLLTAAVSAPDVCAHEFKRAWAVNVTAANEFIAHAFARGARVVFFSSDSVYGSRDTSFSEIAESRPTGEYAVMKSEVEKRFAGNSLFKSIRLSYVFSRDDRFTKYLSDCAARDEEAEVYHPFCRSIIHRDDVVDGVLALARRWNEFPQQVINFGGPAVLSRIEFADCLIKIALPHLKYRVTEPGADFFKNRPRVIAMTSDVLPKLLQRSCRSLFEAVQIEFGKD